MGYDGPGPSFHASSLHYLLHERSRQAVGRHDGGYRACRLGGANWTESTLKCIQIAVCEEQRSESNTSPQSIRCWDSRMPQFFHKHPLSTHRHPQHHHYHQANYGHTLRKFWPRHQSTARQTSLTVDTTVCSYYDMIRRLIDYSDVYLVTLGIGALFTTQNLFSTHSLRLYPQGVGN